MVDIIHDMYNDCGEEDQKYLEVLYGKHVIQSFVNSDLSTEWIKENSIKCPSCNIAIQVLPMSI